MSARRPALVARELQAWLQAAVSCVTPVRLTASREGFDPSSSTALPHTITLPAEPTRLPGAARIALSVGFYYRVLQAATSREWRTTTAGYLYGLHDEHGREIIAYHWHPGLAGQAQVPYPHLHIGPGAVSMALLDAAQSSRQHNALRPEFHRLHLPTRRIALEDVVRLAIEQFEVTPRNPDWGRVLHEAREYFRAARSWV